MHLLTWAVRLGPVVMLMLMGVEYAFYRDRFVWLIIPDIAATALIVLAADWALERIGGAASAIHLPGSRGTPTAREYSEQEALVIRGRYVEAADSYRAIVADDPGNIDARLRLGRLLEHECADPAGAEEVYRRVRGLSPSPQQDWIVANALIDLYHRTGQPDREKAELARMSRQYANTAAGTSARRRLDELAEEHPPEGSVR